MFVVNNITFALTKKTMNKQFKHPSNELVKYYKIKDFKTKGYKIGYIMKD